MMEEAIINYFMGVLGGASVTLIVALWVKRNISELVTPSTDNLEDIEELPDIEELQKELMGDSN